MQNVVFGKVAEGIDPEMGGPMAHVGYTPHFLAVLRPMNTNL